MLRALRATSYPSRQAALGFGPRLVPTCTTHHHLNITSMGTTTTRATVPEVYLETEDPIVTAFQEHQKTAARLAPAELARTWMALAKHAVLATVDKDAAPVAQIAEFITDEQGMPVFVASTLSPHTQHLLSNGRVSVLVTSPNFSSLADGRMSLQGTVRQVTDQEKAPLREAFLKKYPTAFYVDFADFKWFILDTVSSLRFNGGFAAAARVTAEQYQAAQPDPVAVFSPFVCGHMNDDHQQDNLAIVAHYTGLADVEAVKLCDIDRLGINAEVTRRGSTFKARIPFTRPAEDRKTVKDVIVEMSRAARMARSKPAPPQDGGASS